MSAHSDSVPVPPGGPAVSRPSAPGSRADEPRASGARARTDRDLELIAQVARGDIDATELLAERMAPRALRVARSLMAGTDDAGDAALHALIELLRSHARYRGQLRLERWADRVMALSVVRFARAVRRRDQPAQARAEAADAGGALLAEYTPLRVDERGARTFEQYLALLPEQSRQILLLRHGLAFALGELSEALQCSLPVAREQLRAARRELRSLVRRKSDGSATVLGQGAQRWCVLRDREALGEVLGPDELEELTRLETRDPEVWAFVAQVRALELFFDSSSLARGGAAREAPQSGAEHELAARSVAALEVTSPTLRNRALALAPPTEAGPDFEGSRWVRRVALGSSMMLAAACVVALWRYEPPAPRVLETRSVRAPALSHAERADVAVRAAALEAAEAAEAAALRPTVEALPTARTALRGARLRSAGRLLPEGALLAQGETVETGDRPGCLQIAPDTELCLAAQSQLKLSALRPRERRIELLAGRVVARIGPLSESVRWSVHADQVEVQAARAVFSAERVPESKQLRVRTLRASVEVHAGELVRPIPEARSASLRLGGGPVEVVVLLPAQAQRDWELLATGLYAAPSALAPTLAKSAASAAGAAPGGSAAAAQLATSAGARAELGATPVGTTPGEPRQTADGEPGHAADPAAPDALGAGGSPAEQPSPDEPAKSAAPPPELPSASDAPAEPGVATQRTVESPSEASSPVRAGAAPATAEAQPADPEPPVASPP